MFVLRTHPRRKIARIAFTPEGTGLFTAQPRVGVRLHSAATGQLIQEFPGTDVQKFYRLLPSPCGRWLAVFQSNQVIVFEITGRVRWALQTRYAYSLVASWAGEDLLIGGGREGILRARNGGAGPVERETQVVDADRVIIKGFSPCGRWFVGCRREKLAVVCDTGTANVIGEVADDATEWLGGRWSRGFTSFGPWQHTWTSDNERPEVFRDPKQGRVGYGGPRGEVFLAPDAEAIAVWCEGGLRIFTQHHESDGRSTFLPYWRRIKVWHEEHKWTLSVGQYWERMRTAVRWMPRFAFVPDGRTMLLVSEGWAQVERWDWTSGSMVTRWDWPLRHPTCVAVTTDKCLAAAGDKWGQIIVWDLD